jgi:methionyl-tRNA formyltransferase
MFNYFFGSDTRSVKYLDIVHKNYNSITVVTLPHKSSGRGRKLKPNPVEEFCVDKNIKFSYYNPETVYEKMSTGICVSFGKIFSEKFLTRNNSIYNIHLSLLPSYRGPSPVENIILNKDKSAGFSIFEINSEVDKGHIFFQESFSITGETYASEIYDKVCSIFDKEYKVIINHIQREEINNNSPASKTYKFVKNDYNLQGQTLERAKSMIRAFDVIGPAFVLKNNQIFKIHKYTENQHEFPIELSDGILYPSIITPEGKKTMKIEDYIRGNL